MDVSIVIVNYNTKDLLTDCLESIYEYTSGIAFEVILVDNASADGSVESVRSLFPAVTVIELDENVGFGRANNRGVRDATGEYLFFLNSDTRLRDNAVRALWSYMKENPACGIAGGNLVDFSGKPIHSFARSFPGPYTDLARFFTSVGFLRYGKNREYNHTGKPMDVAYVTGADLMMRRDLFEKAGGFDPDFFMYYEETELCFRVKRLGYSVRSVPSVVIGHKKGGSLDFVQDARETVHRSKYLYLEKVYGRKATGKAHACFQFFCACKRIALELAGKKDKARKIAALSETDDTVYASLLGGVGS